MSTTHTQTKASAARRWGICAAIAGTLLVLTATFFIARYVGSEAGMQAARDQIEAENDLTAGPESLIKSGGGN